MTSANEPESVAPGQVPPDPQAVASSPGGEALVPADGGHPRRAVHLLSLVLLIALGLAGVAGGSLAFGMELTRHATRAEATAALGREIATRWRRLPAGKIFPAQIHYQNAQDDPAIATLVGIAPPASCRASLEPSALQRIRALGCITMLRATYLDASKTLAATVSIGVMASPSAAARALDAIYPLKPAHSLYALPFSGTIANAFGNAQRGAATAEASGPYIFLYTGGYTDGLPGKAAHADPELSSVGTGILGVLVTRLTSHGAPCTMKDIRC